MNNTLEINKNTSTVVTRIDNTADHNSYDVVKRIGTADHDRPCYDAIARNKKDVKVKDVEVEEGKAEDGKVESTVEESSNDRTTEVAKTIQIHIIKENDTRDNDAEYNPTIDQVQGENNTVAVAVVEDHSAISTGN